jgi:HEAT repeat protein
MSFFGLFGPPNIEKLKAKKDVGGLIKALAYYEESVAIDAAKALGDLRDRRAVEPLLSIVKGGRDTNYHLRAAAAMALIDIGEPDSLKIVAWQWMIPRLRNTGVGDEGSDAEFIKFLRKFGAAAVLFIMDAHDHRGGYGYDDEHNKFVKALTVIGASAINPLIFALNHEKYPARQSAAKALGEIGDSRAVGPLIAALQDESSSVRESVVEVLGKIGDSRAVGPLIAALQDESSSVRESVVEVLGTIRDSRALEPLIAALQDQRVAEYAAKALGTMGDSCAVEPLIIALQHKDSSVRSMAAEALGKIGDIRAVEPLITALQDRSEDVTIGNTDARRSIAAALGEIGDVRAIEPLTLSVKKDKDLGVRTSSALALEKLDFAISIESRISDLNNQDPGIRRNAAEVLAGLGDTRAIGPLIPLLADSNVDVCKAAVDALRRLDEKVARQTIERLCAVEHCFDKWKSVLTLRDEYKHARKCVRCGYIQSEQHVFGEWEWDLSNPDKDGEKFRDCKICSYSEDG